MARNTHLAATQFTDQGVTYIRVYYQDDENYIKESCYDSANGWYINRDGVVARNAKKNSPIASTSWADGKEIRVYYLNSDNKILERKYSAASARGAGSWEESLDLKSSNVSNETQLTVARTGRANTNVRVRVFYQAEDSTLRQTIYNSRQGAWNDSLIESESGGSFKARPGSGLAATMISGVRLFYQDTDGVVKRIREADDEWENKRLGQLSLDENAPISITSWSTGNSEHRIQVYSVKDNKLIAKPYDADSDNWSESRVTPNETLQRASTIAAVSSADGSISVFLQTDGKTIGQYSERENRRLSLGIPISLGSSPAPSSGAEVNRLTRENERLNDENNRLQNEIKRLQAVKEVGVNGSGMLGLVARNLVDKLTEQQRERFITRLRGVVNQYFATTAWWDQTEFKGAVEGLSAEFSLGVRWQGAGGIWNRLNQSTSAAIIGNVNAPKLERLEASVTWLALSLDGKTGSDYMNKYLFVDTVYQLCRYFGLE